MDSIKFYGEIAEELEVILKKVHEFNKSNNIDDEYDFEHDIKLLIDGMNNIL